MKMARAVSSRLLAGVHSNGITGQVSAREGTQSRASVERVARAGIAAFFVYAVGIGLTYCSQLVIARIVGVETYGIYAYVFSWMVVLAYFSALGFDVAVLRFLPAYQADRAWPLARGMIEYAQRRAAVASFSLICVGALVVLARGSPSELRNSFLVGFALVPVIALVRIRCSVVRALGGVVSALVPDRVVRDGMVIGLLGIASYGLNWTIDAPSTIAFAVVGSTVGLGCTGLALRWRRPRAISAAVPVYDAPAWRRAAIPLVIIGATEVLMNRTGVILLGWIGDTKSAGIYSLVFNIALVVTLPRIAVNTMFAPEISGLYARNDKAMMQLLVTRAASWTLAGGICIAVGLYMLAGPLLAWFGAGYEAGVSALRILLLCQVITAGAGSQLYVMTMTGHERSAAVLLISSAVANAVASAALIHALGLTGAAIGTAIAFIVWNVAMSMFLWQRLKLLPGVLAMFRVP